MTDVDSKEGQYEERPYREEAMHNLEQNGGDIDMEKEGHEGNKDKERSRESRKHRSKDRKKEHRSKDRGKSKEREKEDRIGKDSDRYDDTREKERVESSRERRKEDRHEYEKDKEHDKDRHRDKERSRDKARDKEKGRGKEHDRDKDPNRDRERVGDRGKDRGREIQRERESLRDYERGKEREKVHDHMRDRDRDRERSHDRDKPHDKSRARDRDYEKEVEKERVKEKDHDRGKDREKDRERVKEREKEKINDREKEDKEIDREREKLERSKDKEKLREKDLDRRRETDRDKSRDDKLAEAQSTSELEERLIKIKQERLKRKPDDASEILSWVSKSRKLEDKRNVEREKAARTSRFLEEQDNIEEEREDEAEAGHGGKDLAGVKILHGLDKVAEGGAVVLTLKDQSILADGDINEEVDMLENVEIGEQRQRDEAYRAAKKKTGIYEDKFSDDAVSRKTILPQYDDPVEDEGVTLDESGRFTGEAEKRLEELRKRIEGSAIKNGFEDLTSSGKTSSDYYTPDEMVQFKKPKKKKSLRKREKLDLDALEAEAISAGLGAGDLGSRKDSKRQLAKEEEAKAEAEMRSNAYRSALAKAEEASKALRQEQTLTVRAVEDDDLVFGEDYEDLEKSLEQARKLALKRKEEAAASGPQAVALLATANKEQDDTQSLTTGEPQENRVVITEMEEFVLGLQFDEETHKPESEDVFMDEDIPESVEHEMKAEVGGWTEIKETSEDEQQISVDKVDIGPDEIIHEVAVGKGLSGALKLLKDRGTLNEGIDWGGRNMDKKKSKLVGITDDTGTKEIHIERTDEFGRIMTPKEAFRMISHKFHGKGPGKMKQEKRMKQYYEDLKTKRMKASDTPSLTMERMREAQARLKSPYLVLSGHVKPGQTSDPRSGFATVEKDHLGSLTPMLGDKKVEHFLGINRKPESGSMGPPPPKKLKS